MRGGRSLTFSVWIAFLFCGPVWEGWGAVSGYGAVTVYGRGNKIKGAAAAMGLNMKLAVGNGEMLLISTSPRKSLAMDLK